MYVQMNSALILYVQKWDIIYQMDCALIGKKGKDLKNIFNF